MVAATGGPFLAAGVPARTPLARSSPLPCRPPREPVADLNASPQKVVPPPVMFAGLLP